MQSRTIMQDAKNVKIIFNHLFQKLSVMFVEKVSEGHSISAKTLSNGIVLFCDVHYKMQ